MRLREIKAEGERKEGKKKKRERKSGTRICLKIYI